MKVINIKDKLGLFDEHWTPKVIGSLNGQHVKLAKLKGEFIWHDHKNEDELFLVIQGELIIEFRDRNPAHIGPGEMIIVPKGVEHKPIAKEEVHVLLFEPQNILHTGDVEHELTVKNWEEL